MKKIVEIIRHFAKMKYSLKGTEIFFPNIGKNIRKITV